MPRKLFKRLAALTALVVCLPLKVMPQPMDPANLSVEEEQVAMDGTHVDLGKLRELSWTLWDPLNLAELLGGWRGQPFEDEYDRYILEALSMLQRNTEVEDVIQYLFEIQSQHMGLGPEVMTDGIQSELLAFVTAISNDPQVSKKN